MKRSIQKEQTGKHLLNIAYQTFSKKGFLATKTLDIAQCAGVSHGTLFMHFPTRELLLIKVIEEFGMRMGLEFQKLTQGKGTVKQILNAHLEMIKEYESFYAQLVIEGPLLPRETRNKIFMIQSGIAHYLEATLKKSKLEIPIHFLLNTWLGLIHYYLTNRDVFSPETSVISKCGDDLLNHFINTFNLRD